MESSNRCTKCNGKSFTFKLHQSYKILWGNKRGRTKEIHKELQDLDPEESPHKERDLIGENVDLDLLYFFPQMGARTMKGLGRKESQEGQEWRSKSCSRTGLPVEEEDPFIGGGEI